LSQPLHKLRLVSAFKEIWKHNPNLYLTGKIPNQQASETLRVLEFTVSKLDLLAHPKQI
jgi:hypothetical protein